jgi:hypothetical protein
MADNSVEISDNIDMEALVQSFANIVCGACFSIGITLHFFTEMFFTLKNIGKLNWYSVILPFSQ